MEPFGKGELILAAATIVAALNEANGGDRDYYCAMEVKAEQREPVLPLAAGMATRST
jgi:hypothetical protein